MKKNIIKRMTAIVIIITIILNISHIKSMAEEKNMLHYIPWSFIIYQEPNFKSKNIATFSPQTVSILEKQIDGWALISTYTGSYWVYLNENKRYMDKRTGIYDSKNDKAPVAIIDPQTVTIIEQDGNWLQIVTWLGPKWINQKNEETVHFSDTLIIWKDRVAQLYKISDKHITKYAESVNKLYEECGKPKTYVILPPSPAQLYLPDSYRNNENNEYIAFDKLKTKLDGPKYIDLRDSFEKHKDEYLYFKTDHHWTALGAYYAYEAFINELGMIPTKLNEYKSGKRSKFKGYHLVAEIHRRQYEATEDMVDDIYYYIPKTSAKVFSYPNANMINGEERQLIYPDFPENKNLYNIFMGGDIALGYIHSNIGNEKSIMVVRDSYGHPFVPYLVDNFEHIYFVEPRYFNKNMILGKFFKEKQIDTLLFLSYSLPAIGGHFIVWGDELQKIAK